MRSLQLVFAEDWLYATGQRAFLDDIVHALPTPAPGMVSVLSLIHI